MPKPASPSGPIAGEALWEATCAELIADRPLIETWLRAATFLNHQAPGFTIGFPNELSLYRDSIARHKSVIEETLARLSHSRLELRIELRSDLEITLAPVEDEPAPDETPEAAPATESPTPETAAATPVVEEEAEDAPPAVSEEDFYSDPLIQKALDEFEGTVVKSQS